MPLGPGKYDDEATAVRAGTGAAGVLLAVFGGNKGNGFSVQANLVITMMLPALLRGIADEIEAALKEGRL